MFLRSTIHKLVEFFQLDKLAPVGSIVGIEINADFLKVLEIHSHESSLTVKHFGMASVPEGAVNKNDIKDPLILGQILKEVFVKSKISTKNIALSVPRSSAIIKDITVDSRLTPAEIESRIWIEAKRLFPNLIEDIYLDYINMGPLADNPMRLEIILTACRKDQIHPYYEIMRVAGLNPAIIDLNSYALLRALKMITKSQMSLQTIALLNISSSLITLIIIHEGTLVYTHELNYDGQRIAKKVTKNENNYSDSINKEGLIADNLDLETLKASISSNLKYVMQFFFSSRPNLRIQHVILAGDCSVAVSNLAELIQEKTGKQTTLAEPFAETSISEEVNKSLLNFYAPSLMLSTGLALSKLTKD